jgi:AcrR family transcriptional regulator
MSVAVNSAKRDERRESILDVARDCFLAEGYAATSMSTIAARLGGSKGTLYNYFKNKDELFGAMMQRQCAELQEALFDADFWVGEPRDRLTRYAQKFLRQLLEPDALAMHRIVVSESERSPGLGRAFYEAGPRVVLERVGEYLGGLMDEGLMRRADPFLAAQHFKDLVLSGLYWNRVWMVIDQPALDEIDRHAELAVDVFLRAYAP